MASVASRAFRVVPLLFLSGFSALLYQTTWLREFRLIFGASTAATAAVLGIFMGGLGLGSALLGSKAETKPQPLEYYAKLELLIAVSAALTPLLLWLVRHTYVSLGGTIVLGPLFGTIVRLLLSAAAIGGPAFLMGGTLPSVLRAAVPPDDGWRHTVALLYGVNTLGAVVGAIAATFYFFENWGNRATIAVAVAINAVVGLAAWWLSRRLPVNLREKNFHQENEKAVAPASFIYVAACTSGFVFLLMEIVWYRMLAPLLGGSAFTFGLILAVALFGIGLGGVLSAMLGIASHRSLNRFVFICSSQAVFMALPYALGDRIALTTMLLRPLGSLGFYGHVMAWTLICAILILPAAIASGVQFPLLISLLGRGNKEIGVQTGRAYAFNAGGAILGSLAGGFGFLPALSAPGVWKLSVLLLCLLAGAGAIAAVARHSRNLIGLIPSGLLIALAFCFVRAIGPTAFWRHSQIGAGRLTNFLGTKNELRDMMNFNRRDICWEADGIESSVALANSQGLKFLVNGRCDGHSKQDAGTQLMLGLIPAALYPQTERALVVGLGSGSTAGWLAAVPGIQQVDVVELEPAMLKVAEKCAPVNHDALHNPKVNVIFGDGREIILTTNRKYDLIASEPSNPYRAGIANLFTREYYEAVAGALTSGGVFAQWVQAYEVDVPTIRTVYATLGSVFKHIETWQTKGGDMLFVAGMGPHPIDATALRQRLTQEPFHSALQYGWNTARLEGFLAHFVGNNSLARAMSGGKDITLNTDNRTVLEFTFARNIDDSQIEVSELRSGAKLSEADRPMLYNGEVDWDRVDQLRIAMLALFTDTGEYTNPKDFSRAQAYNNYLKGNLEAARAYWRQSSRQVEDLLDVQLLAECLADEKSDEAFKYIDEVRKFSPTEADAITAHYFLQRGQFEDATNMLERTFYQLRSDPWPNEALVGRTLVVALRAAQHSKSDSIALRLYEALEQPFSVFNNEEKRRITLLDIARILDKGHGGTYSRNSIELAEPHVPWQEGFLELRKECYRNTNSPRLTQAEKDWNEFTTNQPTSLRSLALVKGMRTKPPETGYATEKTAQ